MRILSLCVVIGLAWAGTAVASGLTVEGRVLQWKIPPGKQAGWQETQWAKGTIRMPYFMGGDHAATERINDVLYLETLEIAAPTVPGSTFTMSDGSNPGGMSELSFEVPRNDEHMLFVEITGEGCGAYCSQFTVDYHFDPRTGQRILLSNVVTPEGLRRIWDIERKDQAAKYQAAVKGLQAALDRAKKKRQEHGRAISDDEISDLEQELEVNQDCAGAGSSQAAFDASFIGDYSFSKSGGLTVHVDGCAPHVVQALDDVGPYDLHVSPAQLAPFLTAYGRALLNGGDPASVPVAPFGQILHGTIGNASITMLLDEPFSDGSLGGRYFYDKYRHPIPLDGTWANGVLTLKSKGEGSTTASGEIFSIRLKGDLLSGTWTGGDRQLPVHLHF